MQPSRYREQHKQRQRSKEVQAMLIIVKTLRGVPSKWEALSSNPSAEIIYLSIDQSIGRSAHLAIIYLSLDGVGIFLLKPIIKKWHLYVCASFHFSSVISLLYRHSLLSAVSLFAVQVHTDNHNLKIL
jgi:hypothetical protein